MRPRMNSKIETHRLVNRTLTIIGFIFALTVFGGSSVYAKTFTVNSTNDTIAIDGFTTLREAICAASTNQLCGDVSAGSPGLDVINFNIQNSGIVHTINLLSPLPEITERVTIDGYSQPGSSVNTAQFGTNAVIRIELNGANIPNNFTKHGLVINNASSCLIRGLAINRFAGVGIVIRRNPPTNAGLNTVTGCFIGTDATGTAALPNGTGIDLFEAASSTIGGDTPAEMNLISGNQVANAGTGIRIERAGAVGNAVTGNLIGTDKNGTAALPNYMGVVVKDDASGNYIGIGGANADGRNIISGNTFFGLEILHSKQNVVQDNYIGTNVLGTAKISNGRGIYLGDADDNLIGGPFAGAGNVISGNMTFGIDIELGSGNNTMLGNFIGTGPDGASDLGNGSSGIVIYDNLNAPGNTIGGTSSGSGNVVAFNAGSGITVWQASSINNAIRQNSIFSNSLLGIDLTTNANLNLPTSNDQGDGDSGPNNFQNFPVVTQAITSGNTTSINLSLNSTASTTYKVELFANPTCDKSNFGEGKQYLQTLNLVTDASGNAATNASQAAVPPGQFITATATDPTGNTSEFSQCKQVTVPVPGSLVFSLASYSAGENGGTATINVQRIGGANGAVSVQYATNGGTATANSDYTSASGTLNWADGDTSNKIFTVVVTDDTLDEANETVSLSLSTPTGGATLGNQSSAVLTIVDDDIAPSVSISDTTQVEGHQGNINADFNLTLSEASGQTVTVDYVTAPGTATDGSDYQSNSGTLTFNPGETNKVVTVLINGDTQDEADENFFVNLSNPSNAGLTKAQGTGTITNDDAPKTSSFGFSSASYSISEDTQFVTVEVTRTGDTTSAAKVSYTTSDTASLTPCTVAQGQASERCDYATSVGTLRWAAGEGGTKSFTIPIIDDVHAEASETFNVNLSQVVGATLGAQQTATITVTDNQNDVAGMLNPVDTVDFYVSMQYIDFLNRLPDQSGFTNWVNTLVPCPGGGYGMDNPTCDRIHVSKSFYQSEEFQGRGYWAYRFYQASLGRSPLYAEFIPDMARVGGPKSPQEEALSKQEFTEEWTQRAEFKAIYDGLSHQAYVDALLQTAGVQLVNKSQLIDLLVNGQKTRAEVLREVVESKVVEDKYYVEGFVSMQYFGYLRRDPDSTGYNNYVLKLTQTGDPRQMVFDFIYSTEYRQRFGPQ
jgi:hypothetical protein